MTDISKHADAVVSTEGLSREDWLEYRRAGIGGSDVAAIKGVSRYTSPYALWANKRGLDSLDSGNAATQWGNDLELVVAQRFAKDYDATVIAVPILLRSKTNPFMLANLDFVIVNSEENPQFPRGEVTTWDLSLKALPLIESILEIKTTGIASRGNAAGWENGSVPEAYELQGHHYALVTGCEAVVFAALVGGKGLVVAGRLYNSPEKDAALIETERTFWNLVETGEAPEVDGSESTTETLKNLYPESVEDVVVIADDFVADTLEEYRRTKKELDELDKKTKALRNRLEAAIGSGESLYYNDVKVATFKSTKPSEKVNTEALHEYLRSEFPGLIENYTEVRPGYRVLRLTKVSE